MATKKLLRKFGFDIVKYDPNHVINNGPIELPLEILKFINLILENNLTMVSAERLYATALACKNAAINNKTVNFVECGVWRGGVSLLAQFIFKFYKTSYKIYMFDTFEGMSMPGDEDFELYTGKKASEEDFLHNRVSDNKTDWCYCSVEEVQENFKCYGLLNTNIKFIKGDVRKTLLIEKNIPKSINVLRLDTDWYESTLIELETLVPKLVYGGTLLIDDYGHWNGAKKAVEEYLDKYDYLSCLNYNDKSGRTSIKL